MKTKIIPVSALMLMVCIMPLKSSGQQEPSTIGEIYDFNIGDIFHFEEDGGFDKITNIEIIDKDFSTGLDTVYYVCDIASKEISPENPYWTYEYYLDTIFYTDLELQIHSGNIDSVYSDPLFYNGRQINFAHDTLSIYEYWNHTFVNGCGLVNTHYEQLEIWVSHDKNLVYYKKGAEEWGNPLYVGIDEISDFGRNIKIFPNPATSFITININGEQPIEEAIIYNHLGQKALVAVPVNNTVDVSWLKPGIYFIEVITSESRTGTKLVVE
jgi:hypothetical protein